MITLRPRTSTTPAPLVDDGEEDELDDLLVAHARHGGVLEQAASAPRLLDDGDNLGVGGGAALGIILRGGGGRVGGSQEWVLGVILRGDRG